MKSVTNIEQIISAREWCKDVISDNGLDLTVFEHSYDNKNLPNEFLLVKSINQTDDGRPINDGTIEICIYVANLGKGDDQSQPNLSRLNDLTNIFIPALKDASKNKIAFNDFRTTLVHDSDIRYFYQSIVINTVSINI